MEIANNVLKYSFITILVLLITLVIGGAIVKHNYDKKIVGLQNTLASKDQTIEAQAGVFQKLTIQADDLRSLLDQKDEQVKKLLNQLKKSDSDILTANLLIIQLKHDLASSGNATQPTADPTKPGIVQVDFDSKKDFLPFQVTGSTFGDCNNKEAPRASMKLSQVRPLKLNVIVSQDRDGTWRTSTTSSEDAFSIDIGLAGVNPFLLSPKWYEKIGLNLDMGVGTGPGFLTGIGVSYQISRFELGPRAWVVVDKAGTAPYFGAQLLWHPFQK